MVVVLRTLTRCRCGKPVPVRVSLAVAERLADDDVVFTYGCRCGVIVEVRVRDLAPTKRAA